MFYWSYEKENPLINICNIVTLRYAPTQRGLISLNMGHIRRKPYPTSRDIEAYIRNVVKGQYSSQETASIRGFS